MTHFIASVPGYMYAKKGNDIYVNLYAQSTGDFALENGYSISLTQTTTYPWEGTVKITTSQKKAEDYTLSLHIPRWSRHRPVPTVLHTYINEKDYAAYTVMVNGKVVNATANDKGYVVITRTWNNGDEVELSLDMSVHKVVANEQVTADADCIAFERGPQVYCLESPGNNNYDVNTALVAPSCTVNVEDGSSIAVSDASDAQLTKLTKLTFDSRINNVKTTLTAIPYYAWANRGNKTTMTVWIKEDKTDSGISDMYVNPSSTIGSCYNLLRQRISENDTTAGIKIMNGKKYCAINKSDNAQSN